jgi:hypothetical protein
MGRRLFRGQIHDRTATGTLASRQGMVEDKITPGAAYQHKFTI